MGNKKSKLNKSSPKKDLSRTIPSVSLVDSTLSKGGRRRPSNGRIEDQIEYVDSKTIIDVTKPHKKDVANIKRNTEKIILRTEGTVASGYRSIRLPAKPKSLVPKIGAIAHINDKLHDEIRHEIDPDERSQEQNVVTHSNHNIFSSGKVARSMPASSKEGTFTTSQKPPKSDSLTNIKKPKKTLIPDLQSESSSSESTGDDNNAPSPTATSRKKLNKDGIEPATSPDWSKFAASQGIREVDDLGDAHRSHSSNSLSSNSKYNKKGTAMISESSSSSSESDSTSDSDKKTSRSRKASSPKLTIAQRRKLSSNSMQEKSKLPSFEKPKLSPSVSPLLMALSHSSLERFSSQQSPPPLSESSRRGSGGQLLTSLTSSESSSPPPSTNRRFTAGQLPASSTSPLSGSELALPPLGSRTNKISVDLTDASSEAPPISARTRRESGELSTPPTGTSIKPPIQRSSSNGNLLQSTAATKPTPPQHASSNVSVPSFIQNSINRITRSTSQLSIGEQESGAAVELKRQQLPPPKVIDRTQKEAIGTIKRYLSASSMLIKESEDATPGVVRRSSGNYLLSKHSSPPSLGAKSSSSRTLL